MYSLKVYGATGGDSATIPGRQGSLLEEASGPCKSVVYINV